MGKWRVIATADVRATIERVVEAETPEDAIELSADNPPTAEELSAGIVAFDELDERVHRLGHPWWKGNVIVTPAEFPKSKAKRKSKRK